MKASTWKFPLACSAMVGVALAVAGCQDATTQEDVADAREELRDEQQETAEARQEGREQVAEAKEDAAPYAVNKPVTNDDAADARQDVAEARQEANEEIREQVQEESAAAIELRTEEQRLAATKARDAFVAEIERTLADAEARIEQLKDASAGETDDTQIASLQSQQDRVEEALEGLKDADLAYWKTHQESVRVAMSDLNSGLTGAR